MSMHACNTGIIEMKTHIEIKECCAPQILVQKEKIGSPRGFNAETKYIRQMPNVLYKCNFII